LTRTPSAAKIVFIFIVENQLLHQGAHTVKYEVKGTTMPTLDILLQAGEAVFTEKDGMAWMSGDVEMETNSRGGFLRGIGRRLAGESFFLTT
jgi:uncharacterized protein (AIM24 family)